ncbi:MAG: glycine cleavage system protein T [Ilumatobacter sp.]|nr:glycine cleavage system protein T [Ilumatobacter sp.]
MIRSDPELAAAVGPRVRKSPFFDATVRAGLAAVSTYNHMWLPMSYGDTDEEYRRLTTGVSMWDVAAQRHTEVSGADADALTQLVTAVDVSGTPKGQAIYAPMVDHAGTLINDPVLLHWFDGSWRFSIADSDVRLWIAAIAHGEGLDACVRELDTATLAIQGPLAFDVTDALGWPWARELDEFAMRTGEIAGLDVAVCRSGWSSEDGVEIFLDDATTESAERLWDEVAEAGRPFDIGPGAPHATERLENTFLSYGTDTGYDADPIELGMEDTLDLDGPAFIGQDVLRRIREIGPTRRLRGVVIDGDALDTLPHPVPFEVDGDRVGLLRAANWSPRFGRNIGLVLADATCTPDTVGTVFTPAGARRAEVVDLPFAEHLAEADAS